MSHIDARQLYHLEPPCGLMNDPNGLVYFNGKCYVFFQWNRFAKDHTSKEWGWFESRDLVRWTFLGSALVPDAPYDRDGVLSGSAVVIGDELYLYYTGKRKVDGHRRSTQCVARMHDGRHMLKLGPAITTPAGFTEHFRDPSVRHLSDGSLLMLIGAQRADGKGSILAYRSTDGLAWGEPTEFARSTTYEMIECTELVALGDQHVLLYCPQRRDNARDVCGESFSAYQVLDLDEATLAVPGGIDLDGGWRLVDEGFDFYSPQTIVMPDGRRILFAWMSRMSDEQERLLGEGCPSIHCQTLPRELSLVDGVLRQRPARELAALLGDVVPARADKGDTTFTPAGRTWHLAARDIAPAQDFAVEMNGGEAALRFDAATGTLTFDRADWAQRGVECRRVSTGAVHDLEVWADRSSIEVFVNGGAHVLSARVMPRSEESRVRVSEGLMQGAVDVRDVRAPSERD